MSPIIYGRPFICACKIHHVLESSVLTDRYRRLSRKRSVNATHPATSQMWYKRNNLEHHERMGLSSVNLSNHAVCRQGQGSCDLSE